MKTMSKDAFSQLAMLIIHSGIQFFKKKIRNLDRFMKQFQNYISTSFCY